MLAKYKFDKNCFCGLCKFFKALKNADPNIVGINIALIILGIICFGSWIYLIILFIKTFI